MAAATPVFWGNKLSCLGSLSGMRFATVNAGVSVYGQGTVARIYSQRTVADINIVTNTATNCSSVTVSAAFFMLFLNLGPVKTDFD